ncbi:MAG: hypothetical protein AAB779_00775, partial [Patescibacteria group bacterium]
MKILFCSGIFPPAIGGPGTVLTKLIPALIERGYICSVATFGPGDNIERPYAVHRIPLAKPQPGRFLAVLTQIWGLADQHNIISPSDSYTHPNRFLPHLVS